MWENCEYILLEKKFWTNMMNEEAGQRGRVGLQVPHRHPAPDASRGRTREGERSARSRSTVEATARATGSDTRESRDESQERGRERAQGIESDIHGDI